MAYCVNCGQPAPTPHTCRICNPQANMNFTQNRIQNNYIQPRFNQNNLPHNVQGNSQPLRSGGQGMKKCATCNKDIARYAKTCVHCGAGNAEYEFMSMVAWLVGIASFFLSIYIW